MMQQVAVRVKRGEYTVIKGNGMGALVSSKTVAGAWHVVKAGACDCEGYAFRGKCSHLEAVKAACLREQLTAAQEVREQVQAEANELAAKLDALLVKVAEAQEREQAARRELEALTGETEAQDAETPHAEQPASIAA